MSAAATHDPAGHGEQPQPEPFRLPPPGRGGGWERECLSPDQQVGGKGDDLQPDLVGGEAVVGQVGQTGVFQGSSQLRV